jgi:membrane associated rhomboid family serine protease
MPAPPAAAVRSAPAARPVTARRAAPAAPSAAADLEFEPHTHAIAPAPAAPPAEPAVSTGAGQSCPSCGRLWPEAARLCTDCGVVLQTGRSVLITQDERLDQIYAAAESTIRLISWIIWMGIYPIASEAFGLRKPYAIRGLALLTVLASFGFFLYLWTPTPPDPALDGLMLWCGRAAEPDAPELDPAVPPAVREMLAALEPEAATPGEFRAHQLLTHALLHADLLHLAGNLLFMLVLATRVNALVGNLWTLALYPLFAVAAGLAQRAASADAEPYPMLGASGAVMGMAGMYFVFFPVHKVHMAFWWRWGLIGGFRLSLKTFAVRGFWVVLFYIAFDVVYTVIGLADDVAHWAHLGGFLAGMVVATLLLLARLVNAHGGDLFSALLGRHAWALVGRPRL